VLAALAVSLAPMLVGCAAPPVAGAAVNDPWEGWNRKVFVFNDKVDEAVLKPVAETYRDTVPQLVRTGVDNVLGNIYDLWSTANHFLQGKVQSGLEMGMRVLTNTFFGLGGLLDPATPLGLVRRSEDFGQTLGVWGVGNGPFLVLPLFGPSTVRDTAGLVADLQASPSKLASNKTDGIAITGVSLVNTRTNLLSTGSLVDSVALDRYSFIRDAYLARRRDALYDGAPPMETFDDEPADKPQAAPPAAPTASAPARPSLPASVSAPASR
jgi:phospholipid-binding lipoprotein MlaA